MGQRLELHALLQSVIGTRPDGKDNVYFQPPPSVRMNYPCIVYSRNSAYKRSADNILYNFLWNYSVTLIDPNPDSAIADKLLALPLCMFDRHYTADNLNHEVFNIYY